MRSRASVLPTARGARVRGSGTIFLTDTTAEAGPFECVPSIYRNVEPFLEGASADDEPNIGDEPIVRVSGEGG